MLSSVARLANSGFGYLIAARGSGERCKLPQQWPPTHFGHILSPRDAILRTNLVHVVCTRLSQFKQICLTDKRTLITCNNAVSLGLRKGALKMTDMKLQDMKLTDRVAGHEIAGHENGGPNSRT